MNVRNIVKNTHVGRMRPYVKAHPDPMNQFAAYFFYGDLNYRIAFGESAEAKTPSTEDFNEMCQIIRSGELGCEELFENDQLKEQMLKGNVFHQFLEGHTAKFRPTFKVGVFVVVDYKFI